MRLIASLLAFALLSGPALAADSWDIEHESKARFEAKVVDILCELTGDCPADCGAGKRQLGLLRDDGKLVVAVKNYDPFAGAVNDLVSFCGKRVVADGLMIDDPQMPVFALQFKRLAPDGKWSRANWFGKDWARNHLLDAGDAMAGQWFRHDETVKTLIEADGVFGIPGLKAEE